MKPLWKVVFWLVIGAPGVSKPYTAVNKLFLKFSIYLINAVLSPIRTLEVVPILGALFKYCMIANATIGTPINQI